MRTLERITPKDGITIEARSIKDSKLLRIEIEDVSDWPVVHVGMYEGPEGEEEGYRFRVKDPNGIQSILNAAHANLTAGATIYHYLAERYGKKVITNLWNR